MKRVTGEPLSSVYYDLRLALDALERVSALADSYENDPMKRPLYDRLITVQMIRTAIAGSGADGEATT
jgi:PHP family Zn ribbon phosphoesterase